MRIAAWLAFTVPFALLAGAYIFEYVFGLYPCEMCWWQRYPHFVAIILATIALGISSGVSKFTKPLIILAALANGVSGLIGGFHAGVEYGWWEGITGCAVTASGDGDILEVIMNAPLIRCDVAPWDLFGISLAGYNFIISILAAMMIIARVIKVD